LDVVSRLGYQVRIKLNQKESAYQLLSLSIVFLVNFCSFSTLKSMISRRSKDFCEKKTVIFQFLEKQKFYHQFSSASSKHVAKTKKDY
jgi:hypothetical protein